MTKTVVRPPSAIDYGFRPASYFEALDPHTLILASILGEERRKDVAARLASGNFDPLVWGDWLTESKLDDSVRRILGRGHPSFMGGEYLPPFKKEEIEIARVVLASVTQDVISVRARRAGKRIAYRVVDEYEGVYALPHKTSRQPLTLGQLIGLIDGAAREDDTWSGGVVFATLAFNIDNSGDPDEMRGFVAVSSNFYPALAGHYDGAIERFIDARAAAQDSEEEEAA